MSENLGVQVELTANAAGFITAINNAKDKLVDLSLQAKNLKQGERDIEKALVDAARQYGENSKQVERYKNDLIDNKRAQLDVRNETNQVNAELRKQRAAFAQATQPAESYSNALSDTARSNEKLTTTLKSGFLALKGIAVGYAGKTLYEALIGSNAEFEQYMTSFDVLLGSAEKAEAMMGELEQFAAVTPLKTEDVTEATQLLLGYGLAEEEVMTTMQQLGDVAQGNAEKLNRVALAYGQMLAKGKVSGEELRQMTEAGVPLTNALAEALDVTTAELSKLIEKGEVGIPTLNQALENMTSEGGQFFGMMEKQSQTLNGLLSTMSDNATMFAREVGDEAFNYLKDELQEVMNTIQQMSEDGSLQAIASGMGEGIAKAITFVGNFIKLLWEMRDAIMLVGGAVLTYKAAMAGLAALQSVIAWGKGVKTTLEAVNTAKQAGITISTLYKAAILQDAVALQACNAAGIKDIATKGGQTVATNAATGATLKFNAALLANPYVLIAAGLVAVTALLTSASASEIAAHGGEAVHMANIEAARNAVKSSFIKASTVKGNRTGVSYTPPASSQSKRSSGSSGSKSSSNDDAEKARKEQLDAYTADIEEKERLDERWYKQQNEYGRLSDEQWLEGLENRANRYRAYADEVLTLSFATEEEKSELRKEYLEKAEDIDLEYFKYYKGLVEEETQARKDAYEERREDSDKWLAQMEEEGNFDAVLEGLERVKVYTADYYEGEKAKLDEFLQAGIYSQEEYNEALKALNKEMNEEMEGLNEEAADVQKDKFDAWYDDAQAYISNRNFYGDWGKWGDSEDQAIARMFAKIDEAFQNGIISREEYYEKLDALSEQIYTLEYDNMQEAIQEQEELLKEKYQKELDMKIEAAQKEIEVAKEKAEAEKEAINEAADNEIKRIDELIQKRKEAREDEDNNLKLARLQAKLAYEHDENNRIALQKEIDKLLQEMADIQFERDMERQKELIETNRDAALQGVEDALDLAIESAERKITIANNRYEEQTSGTNMAMELAKIFNLQSFEDIYKTIGVDIESGITKGLQGIFDALSSSLNEVAGVKTSNYDYSTSGNTYQLYNTFSGVQTPAQVAQALRRLLDQIELEGYM